MTTIYNLIEKSGMNKNQVSKISGISNTYLSKIEQFEAGGNRIKIKRKTLINIAISLNLSLLEINSLLKEYGHEELSISDSPAFLSASENQSVTGIIPIFSSLVTGWFLIGIEKALSVTEGASMEYVLDQPTNALKSSEHASFTGGSDFSNNKLLPLHKDLIESACTYRRKLITQALDRGNCINTYICSNCFERYTLGWERYKGTHINEDKYKVLLREHLETLIKYIETYPDQYRLRFLKKCPRIRYELFYAPIRNEKGVIENKISKVIFLGRESLCNADRKLWWNHNFGFGQGFGDLLGFATDVQNLMEFFHKQHVGLKEHFIDDRFDNPKKTTEYIKDLISKNIPASD